MKTVEKTDIQAQELAENLPAVQMAGGGYMAMIEKLAANPTLQSVEVIERMMAMQEKWEARQAEKEFNEALSRIAQRMPRIVKDRGVSYKEGAKDAFRYATYEEIDKAIRPLLIDEGMSLSYTTEMKEGGGAIVTGTLSHRNGHSKSASIPVPLDSSGGKNAIQGMGSTYSYGKRYTMCMLLNIVTMGEDDDGMGGPIDAVMTANINAMIKESCADTARFLKYMHAETVESILFKDYQKATKMLEEKKKQKGKSDGVTA